MRNGKERKNLEGLYGCRIAWPEKIYDPQGNVEYILGYFTFLMHAKRVIPEYVLPKIIPKKNPEAKL